MKAYLTYFGVLILLIIACKKEDELSSLCPSCPEVLSISPISGLAGDTLTLLVKNMNKLDVVLFNEHEAAPLDIDEKTGKIKVIVPDLKKDSVVVGVKSILNNFIVFSNVTKAFVFKSKAIKSFSPSGGVHSTPVTIFGTFDKANLKKILIGNKEVTEIQKITRDSIICLVPKGAGINKIRIEYKSEEIISSAIDFNYIFSGFDINTIGLNKPNDIVLNHITSNSKGQVCINGSTESVGNKINVFYILKPDMSPELQIQENDDYTVESISRIEDGTNINGFVVLVSEPDYIYSFKLINLFTRKIESFGNKWQAATPPYTNKIIPASISVSKSQIYVGYRRIIESDNVNTKLQIYSTGNFTDVPIPGMTPYYVQNNGNDLYLIGYYNSNTAGNNEYLGKINLNTLAVTWQGPSTGLLQPRGNQFVAVNQSESVVSKIYYYQSNQQRVRYFEITSNTSKSIPLPISNLKSLLVTPQNRIMYITANDLFEIIEI